MATNIGGFVKGFQDIMRNDAGVNGDAQRMEQIVWMLFLKVYDTKESLWEFSEDKFKSIIPEQYRWRNWAVDRKDGQAITGDALIAFVEKLFSAMKQLPIDDKTEARKAIVPTVFRDLHNYMKDGVLLRQTVNLVDGLELDGYTDRHAFGEIYETLLKSLQSAGNAGEYYTPRAVTDFMAFEIAPKLGERIADFACGTGGFLTSALKILNAQLHTTDDKNAYNHSIYGIEKKPLPYVLCITNMLLHDIDSPDIYLSNSLIKNVRDYEEKDRFPIIMMNPPYGGSEKSEIKDNFPVELRSSETADLFIDVIMYRLKKNGRAAVIIPDGFLFGVDNAKQSIKRKLFHDFNVHTIIRMPSSVFSPYTSITTNIIFFDNTNPTAETWFYRLDMPEGFKHFSKTKPIEFKHFQPAIDWWSKRQEIKDADSDSWKSKKFSVQELADRGFDIDLCGYPKKEDVILSPEETMMDYIEKRTSLNEKIDEKLEDLRKLLEMKA